MERSVILCTDPAHSRNRGGKKAMTTTQLARGLASDEDAQTTTEAALTAATDGAPDAPPTLALAFVDAGYDVSVVQKTLTENLPAVTPLIGATTAGEFIDGTVEEGGIVVALIHSDDLEVATALIEDVGDDVIGTTAAIADELPAAEDLPHEHTVAINLHDGLSGAGEQITLALSQQLGNVPMAGGSAGDGLQLSETTVFTGDTVSSTGLAVALLNSPQPFGVASNHGHEPISDELEVTSADGNTVHELNGEPAFDVYREEVQDLAMDWHEINVNDLTAGSEEFNDLLTRFEFGVPTTDGDLKIRWPGLTETPDGSIQFATSIPEGTTVRVCYSPLDEQVPAAREATAAAADTLETDPGGALVFECFCRQLMLGDDFVDAVDAVSQEAGVPLAGLETYGEVSMNRDDTSGYHNATTSVLLLP
ncbi:FIST signal transduction protein [Halobaculum sp. MBLA0147]|uniref:FIST signal transduction protein n=1 Tax=Halobaculum sp. MBLA0147 TaxID=3079934 RepID=UPI0035232354